LEKILVTDSFAPNGTPKLNQEIEVGEQVEKAFSGRALFFLG